MKNNKKAALPGAVILCVLSLILMCWALARPAGGFSPPPFEKTAGRGVPEIPDTAGWSELDARDFRVGISGKPVAENGRLTCWLTNPEDNSVWLRLRILDGDRQVLGQTGLIRPGEYVQSVDISGTVPAGEVLILKIMAYEPETYYSMGTAELKTNAVGRNGE